MKVLMKKEDLCVACNECELVCSSAFFKEKNPLKSCIRIKKDPTSIVTCTQCGECIEICPVEAIYRDQRGIVRIKKDICVGCFMCVGFCDEEAMFMHEDYIEPFKCVSCGLCATKCPTGAIFIEEVKEEN